MMGMGRGVALYAGKQGVVECLSLVCSPPPFPLQSIQYIVLIITLNTKLHETNNARYKRGCADKQGQIQMNTHKSKWASASTTDTSTTMHKSDNNHRVNTNERARVKMGQRQCN
jgi:hypothetical protein